MGRSNSILFVGPSLEVGGAGKMIKVVADFASEVFDKVYITSRFTETPPLDLSNRVVFVKMNVRKTTSPILWYISIIKQIRRLVKTLSVDVVCSFVSDICVLTRIATLGMKKVKVISAERGDPYTLPIRWRPIVKWAYNTSDYCFFQLPKARDYFGSQVSNKSFVIPNPVLLNIQPIGDERACNIVAAGRFVPEKGFDLLIKAFSQVHQKYKNFTLTIYGDGQLRGYYERLISDLELNDCVNLPGFSSQLNNDMRDAYMFVLPSLYEGIPNVLVEAMCLGLPTVSFNCSPGGPAFLTDNGNRGILVPIGDITNLVNSMILLIEDKHLYDKLCKAGPEIKNLYNIDYIKSQWISAFTSILNES